MQLFLVRHGAAEEKLGKSDPERALTQQGRDDVKAMAEFVGGAVRGPMRLLSSPYLRAEQTAEILRESLGIKEKITPTDALLPEAEWPDLRAVLVPLDSQGTETVIAVGHNPSISLIVATIAAGSADARIPMSKGAVAFLDVDHLNGRPAGELKWLLSPKAVRGRKAKG